MDGPRDEKERAAEGGGSVSKEIKRLTANNVSEMDMVQLALNQVYIADGQAWYVKGPDEECSVCDLIRDAAETLEVDLPMLGDAELSDFLADWFQYGSQEPEGVLAILYRALWSMAELRERLRDYEDTGLEPEEITTGKAACVFYCNRRCNLDGDWCPEGPGCRWELSPEAAMALISPPDPPLTLEELREMDGEPVWSAYYQCWGLISVCTSGKWAGIPFFHFTEDGCQHEKSIEQRRLTLYRRKPEEGTP